MCRNDTWAGERLANFFIAAIRVLFEERRRSHDPAANAIFTLSCFFVDKRLLHGVRLAVHAQSIKRTHLALHGRDGHDAGANRDTIEDDGTGTALCQATAEFWPFLAEVVTQRVEERHHRVGRDHMILAVDVNREFLVHVTFTSDVLQPSNHSTPHPLSRQAAPKDPRNLPPVRADQTSRILSPSSHGY